MKKYMALCLTLLTITQVYSETTQSFCTGTKTKNTSKLCFTGTWNQPNAEVSLPNTYVALEQITLLNLSDENATYVIKDEKSSNGYRSDVTLFPGVNILGTGYWNGTSALMPQQGQNVLQAKTSLPGIKSVTPLLDSNNQVTFIPNPTLSTSSVLPSLSLTLNEGENLVLNLQGCSFCPTAYFYYPAFIKFLCDTAALKKANWPGTPYATTQAIGFQGIPASFLTSWTVNDDKKSTTNQTVPTIVVLSLGITVDTQMDQMYIDSLKVTAYNPNSYANLQSSVPTMLLFSSASDPVDVSKTVNYAKTDPNEIILRPDQRSNDMSSYFGEACETSCSGSTSDS